MKQRINIKTLTGGATVGLLALTAQTNVPAQTAARIVFQAPVAVQTAKHGSTSFWQVFSMNPDSTALAQLTTTSTNSLGPRWSPDQGYISFWRAGLLWVMQAQGEAGGGQSFAVAPAGWGGADWSPDGSTLVFQGTDQGLHLVSVNASAGTAGTPVLLHSGSWFNPSWSPDGTLIAANGSLDGKVDIIAVFDATSGAVITTFGAAPDYNYSPRWNPGGTRIAFTGPVIFASTSRSGKTTSTTYQEVFLANPDGTGLTQVTDWSSGNSWPTWSPDGTALAFCSSVSGSFGVYRMVLGSSTATLLYSGGNQPDWNP